MTKPTKERRKHIFKRRSYLEATSDRIVTTLPTQRITYNTLLAIYEVGVSDGYTMRIEDASWFKMKREEHRKNSFNMVKDFLDDVIHNREPRPQGSNHKKKKKK